MFRIALYFLFSDEKENKIREYDNAQAALDSIRCICEETPCKSGVVECYFIGGEGNETVLLSTAIVDIAVVNERAAVNHILPLESRWDEDFLRSLLYIQDCFDSLMGGLRTDIYNLE